MSQAPSFFTNHAQPSLFSNIPTSSNTAPPTTSSVFATQPATTQPSSLFSTLTPNSNPPTFGATTQVGLPTATSASGGLLTPQTTSQPVGVATGGTGMTIPSQSVGQCLKGMSEGVSQTFKSIKQMQNKLSQKQYQIKVFVQVGKNIFVGPSSVCKTVDHALQAIENDINGIQQRQKSIINNLKRVQQQLFQSQTSQQAPLFQFQCQLQNLVAQLGGEAQSGLVETAYRILSKLEKDVRGLEERLNEVNR